MPDLSPRYTVIRTLGRGTYGHVVLAEDTARDNVGVAVKVFERGTLVENSLLSLEREILHHASMDHPFVIRLYEVYLTPKYLCLAMELGISDLSHYVSLQPENRVSEHTARYLLRQLVIGLDYIHSSGVANRDIKLENLILTDAGMDGNVVLKISDFGCSKNLFNNSTPMSGVGTVGYIAPEIIIGGIAYNAHVTDIWSVGVILYKLVAGRNPFDTHSPTHAQDVIKGRYIPLDGSESAALKDLIHRMLEPKPQRRITMGEIMKHPWFVEGFESGDLSRMNHLSSMKVISDEAKSKISAMLRLASQSHQTDMDACCVHCTFNAPPL